MLRSDAARRVLALLSLAGLMTVAACAANTAKKSSSLCTADDTSGCKDDSESAGGKTAGGKSKGGSSNDGTSSSDLGPDNNPVPSSKPSDGDAGAATKADAGQNTDAGTPDDPPVDDTPGPDCTALDSCCDALSAAGYSPTTCKSVVSDGNEFSCYNALQSYRNPPEGEFSCP
jgi:hypothetical protein